MAPPRTSPPSSPPSELGEISLRRPRRGWRRLSLLRVRLGVIMMGEGFRRSLLQVVEPMVRGMVYKELEKFRYNYTIPQIPGQLVGGAQHARYHLKFQNKICDPLYTSRKIEGEAGSDVEIALFDNDKKVIVTSDPFSSIEVEIVVLDGDFNNDDRETWSEEEFNKRIALPRDNRGQLLKGERFIKLNNGIGSLGNITFTDNSSSQKTKKFRLGVRYAQSVPNGERIHERIQEGITEPLRVKEHRVESSQKHPTPSLDDEVWRLKHIRKDGIYHEKLQGLGIKTVQDFLRYYNLDKGKLRNILGSRMSENCWKEIVKHAEKCDLGDKLCSFSMRENSVVPVVLFFNSIYRLVGVKFGDCYTTLDNLDISQQDSVESWKNLAYGNINGMQFDHRMINGNPKPLLSSDTFLPGPSSLPHIQIRNYDQVYSQVGLLQETSIASEDSPHLLMEHTSIDMHNHQTEQYTSIAETNNLPLEMGYLSLDNITTTALNSELPGLPVTHNEACYGTQPYSLGIESLEQSRTAVKDVSFERDNSLVSTLQGEMTPTEDTSYPQIYGRQLANYDTSHEQGTQMCSQNQVESSPFMESLRVQPTFSRMNSLDLSALLGGETSRSFSLMSSFDPSSLEGLIQTFINNLPASSCGETSRSIAPPSPRPRWVKLLAPIKWVHFTKKRRAPILIHQTLVATV